MSQRREHLQGLQIPGGTPAGKWESRGWTGTFVVREAIILCPDNLNKSEEFMYFDSLFRVIEGIIRVSKEQAGGATYRTPYLLVACLNVYDVATQRKKRVTKQDMLDALYVDDDIASSEPNIFSEALYLSPADTRSLKSSRMSLFWCTQLDTFETDRVEEGRPPLKFLQNSSHKRAKLWDHLYSDCDASSVLHEVSDPEFTSLFFDLEKLHELDDTPSRPDVAPSRTQIKGGPKSNKLSKKRVRGSTNDVEELQPPVIEVHASPEPDADDIPLAKRRKAVPAEKSTRGTEVDVPEPTRPRVTPRRPARTVKVVQPPASIPEPQPTASTRRNPKRHNNAVPDQKKELTAEKKQVVTKKGDVDVPDGSSSVVAVDAPRLPEGVAGKQGSKRTSQKMVVGNVKGTSGGGKGKSVAVDLSDHEPLEEESVASSDEFIPDDNESEDSEDEDDDEPEAAVEVAEASVEKTAQQAEPPIVETPLSELIAEAFNDPSFKCDWALVTYDRWAKILPIVWFYLHPFAEEFLVEQFAPAACDACVRSGSPCVIRLKSFVGCYACKKRSVYCSLGAGINKKGFKKNKALAWWITLLHHICSVLELGTPEGCISVLPDYAGIDLKASKIPKWAINAFNTIRKPLGKDEVKQRWKDIETSLAATWKFYSMPHSLLSSLRKERPKRPYWPCPGEREKDVIDRGIAILKQGRDGTLPRTWVSRALVDGYEFSSKDAAREARMMKKEAALKKKANQATGKRPSMTKDDTPVPPEPDEALISDTEESSIDDNETIAMDVDVPSSPIPPPIADTDYQASVLPPPPSMNVALEEEHNFAPNPSLTRDSSPADLQLRSSARKELDAMRDSINSLVETVGQLRHPSFTQNQIDLLLPTMVSQLERLTGNADRVQATVERLQATVDGLQVTTARTDNAVQDHTSAIADMKAQLSAYQASPDTHWPKFQKELETFRSLLVLHLPLASSTNVAADGTNAYEDQLKDVDTSTVATASEHPNISVVTSEDHLVVHTTPATEESHVGPDDSRSQSATETTVDPVSREQAVDRPMQDIGLPDEIGQAVAEAIQGPNLSASPPANTISQDAHGLDDHDRANQDAADTFLHSDHTQVAYFTNLVQGDGITE